MVAKVDKVLSSMKSRINEGWRLVGGSGKHWAGGEATKDVSKDPAQREVNHVQSCMHK